MPKNDAMLPDVRKWLDFALQQVAAESYLNFGTPGNQATFRPWLIRGNTPLPPGTNPDAPPAPDQYVAMTSSQADEFLRRFQIKDHHANDASGFSAALLFDTASQQYTLAIRSTEYKNPSLGGDYCK